MEKILVIIRVLSALVEAVEILYPEKGRGKEKLEEVLILFAEQWEEGKQWVEASREKLEAVIARLVSIKNLLNWKKTS